MSESTISEYPRITAQQDRTTEMRKVVLERTEKLTSLQAQLKEQRTSCWCAEDSKECIIKHATYILQHADSLIEEEHNNLRNFKQQGRALSLDLENINMKQQLADQRVMDLTLTLLAKIPCVKSSSLNPLRNQISCQIQHVCEARRRLGKGSMPVEAALQTLLAQLQSLQDSLSLPNPCFTKGSTRAALAQLQDCTSSLTRSLQDHQQSCRASPTHLHGLSGAASVLQGLSDSSQMVSAALQEYQGAIAGAAAEPAQAAALTLGDVGCSYQQSPTYDDNTPQAMAEAGADLAAVNGAPALTEPSEIRQRSLRAKRKRGDSDTAEGCALPAEECTKRVCTHSDGDFTNASLATGPGAFAPLPGMGAENGRQGSPQSPQTPAPQPRRSNRLREAAQSRRSGRLQDTAVLKHSMRLRKAARSRMDLS